MRKLLIVTVASFLTMPVFAWLAHSTGLCPPGFQIVFDVNKAVCIASFDFKAGSCPSGSKLFTMDGKHLCLHNRRPQEKENSEPRSASEPVSIVAGLAHSIGLCPSGFEIVYDINKAVCIGSFDFKDGSCPSASKLFTMDGKHLCLHSQSPQVQIPH
jgi:hypothetical protein